MTEDKVRESKQIVDALEKELVEDVKANYREISEVLKRVVDNIEGISLGLLNKVDSIYHDVENRK